MVLEGDALEDGDDRLLVLGAVEVAEPRVEQVGGGEQPADARVVGRLVVAEAQVERAGAPLAARAEPLWAERGDELEAAPAALEVGLEGADGEGVREVALVDQLPRVAVADEGGPTATP